MKRMAALLMAALWLALYAGMPALADFDPEDRESVVMVSTWVDIHNQGSVGMQQGTGFFVGNLDEAPMYLITNYHVIKGFVEMNAGDLNQFKLDNGETVTGRSKIRVYYDTSDYEEAYLVEGDEQKDIAILKLDKPTSKRKPLPLYSPSDDMVGGTIYAIGYPGLADNVFSDPTTTWKASDATVTSGSISRIFTTSGTGRVDIQVDCEIRHGNSGGPMLCDNGGVIGINSWGTPEVDSEKINYAISIDEAIFYLKRNDIPYEMVEDSAPVSSESIDVSSAPAPEPTPQPQPGPSPLTIGLIAGAAILVVGAVIAVVLLKKPKNEKADPNPAPPAPVPQPVPQPAPARMPYVRSRAQQHRGARVAVQDPQIMIGRSPQDCALVFNSQTPGVSGRHCSLAFDYAAGDFVLTDLRSSYGTFLENGQRLTPHVPYRLRAGDSFYLGERENLLTVELD